MIWRSQGIYFWFHKCGVFIIWIVLLPHFFVICRIQIQLRQSRNLYRLNVSFWRHQMPLKSYFEQNTWSNQDLEQIKRRWQFLKCWDKKSLSIDFMRWIIRWREALTSQIICGTHYRSLLWQFWLRMMWLLNKGCLWINTQVEATAVWSITNVTDKTKTKISHINRKIIWSSHKLVTFRNTIHSRDNICCSTHKSRFSNAKVSFASVSKLLSVATLRLWKLINEILSTLMHTNLSIRRSGTNFTQSVCRPTHLHHQILKKSY